ncbi:PEP-CTERM sorting domain-containing protein [Verrucomicrobiaceae bacterium 227]
MTPTHNTHPRRRSTVALPVLALAAYAIQMPLASAAQIAGSDFSDSAVFNAPGGAYDNSDTSTDDLNPSDNVTVSGWTFANGGAFSAIDANAQVDMPSDLVTKIDGAVSGTSIPAIGSDPSSLSSVSFSIIIPENTIVDLTSVTFDWRKATPSANVRWLAFNTSLDSGLLYSQNGQVRNNVDSANIDLSGALYQGLTNQTVTFNWYAGGEGSGDVDFDTPIVNGTVSQVPEPSGSALFGLGILGMMLRRRR